jgi:hypothetical protein
MAGRLSWYANFCHHAPLWVAAQDVDVIDVLEQALKVEQRYR